MKSVGERIRQARLARGMSQAALAERCGFKNQSAIGNLENRETGRGGFSLPKIAEVLEVPLQWLLDGPDTETVPKANEAAATRPAEPSTTPYSDRDKAIAILERLAPAPLREALHFLEYLEGRHATPSSDGADLPASAPSKRVA